MRELVQRSREEQGLPPHVEDPGTLARVAELIALAGSTRRDTAKKTARPSSRETRRIVETRTRDDTDGWERRQNEGALAAAGTRTFQTD